MTDSVDDIEALLLDSAAAFLRSSHSTARVRALAHTPEGHDGSMWREMAKMGWTGIRLPESLGGTNLDLAHATALAEAFGEALLPEPFVACAVMPSAILSVAATIATREALGIGLAEGSRTLAVAWQSRFGELDPMWSDITIEARDGRLVVCGSRTLVETAATDWLVPGLLAGEPVIVAIAADTSDVKIVRQRMSDGTNTNSIDFNGAAVPSTLLLLRGDAARNAMADAMNEGRLVLAAQLAGLARGALRLGVGHVQQRIQFGQPIASFQAIRHRLVDLKLQTDLATASWRHAVSICRRSSLSAEPALAAIHAAKARCTDAAVLIAKSCIQLHGAMGYTEEADIGLYMNAALRAASALGNADAHRRRFVTRASLETLTG